MLLNRLYTRVRTANAKLLKTPVRGGVLTLTNHDLLLGEGWLGAKNVRRFPLQSLERLDLLPAPSEQALRRRFLLRFVWADGQVTEVDGVGPAAARHIHAFVQALCPMHAPA